MQLLELSDLRNRTFLDIGCGSGVFSLVAHRLGATVVSVDLDPLSIDCCRRLHQAEGLPATWSIRQGSILDEDFCRQLPQSDIVYSWGVLHHTGDMFRALTLAASLVRPGGLLCIAIYNRVESRVAGSRSWWRVKRMYVSQSGPVKRLMELAYGTFKGAALVATLQNPLSVARKYHRTRGMSLWHDWVDWLGGFPYEYASAGEIFAFARRELGLEMLRLNTTSSLGCNEFVFSKPGPTA